MIGLHITSIYQFESQQDFDRFMERHVKFLSQHGFKDEEIQKIFSEEGLITINPVEGTKGVVSRSAIVRSE